MIIDATMPIACYVVPYVPGRDKDDVINIDTVTGRIVFRHFGDVALDRQSSDYGFRMYSTVKTRKHLASIVEELVKSPIFLGWELGGSS